jgi:hypothetical protein
MSTLFAGLRNPRNPGFIQITKLLRLEREVWRFGFGGWSRNRRTAALVVLAIRL